MDSASGLNNHKTNPTENVDCPNVHVEKVLWIASVKSALYGLSDRDYVCVSLEIQIWRSHSPLIQVYPPEGGNRPDIL